MSLRRRPLPRSVKAQNYHYPSGRCSHCQCEDHEREVPDFMAHACIPNLPAHENLLEATKACRLIDFSIRLCRDPQKRQAYKFCNHTGPCSDSTCQCVQASTTCERGCGCLQSCRRRFPTCHCIDGCGPRCLCRENAHECVHCSCSENCSNHEIQSGHSQSTAIRRSKVHGYGLFAEIFIVEGTFIDEYKGTERRKASSSGTAVADFIISTSEIREVFS